MTTETKLAMLETEFGSTVALLEVEDGSWLATDEFTACYGAGPTTGDAISALMTAIAHHAEFLRHNRSVLADAWQPQLDALDANRAALA